MGGDRAPEAIVAGARQAASAEVVPVLYGAIDRIRPLAGELAVVDAPTVVEMDEKPTDAAREKRDSSLFAVCRAVARGEADVALSAGNTGAMLAAALLEIGRLPGVQRPAIAVVVPARSGPSVLIDAGANADARPEHLVQFAHMGSIFAEELLNVAAPQVGLLSIGEEPEKGNRFTVEAHDLLARSPGLAFVGNVESRLLLERPPDVVVCDGFVGNMALKMLEGTIRTTLELLREEIVATPRGKLGGLLIRPAARRLRKRFDPEVHGGAFLLGLRGLVVIAHGNSTATATANAIGLGVRGVEHRVVERLGARLAPAVGAPAAS